LLTGAVFVFGTAAYSCAMRFTARSITAWLACGAISLSQLAGCKDADSYLGDAKAIIANSPTKQDGVTTPRAAAAKAIAADIEAGRYIMGDALDYAQRTIESAANGAGSSEQATQFAGAVLDSAVLLEDRLPHAGEFELFWTQVGRLAFRAAEEALARGREREALTLAIAGPQRWQNDSYWERYSDHDGLTSLLMARMGQAPLARERLERRGDLKGVALEVYNQLK
jgi:hypothetical protein